MKTRMQDFEVLVPNLEGDGIAERVTVKVQERWDEELGEWLLAPEAHKIIEDTKARRMGLLLPEQFLELRKRFGLSQKEMGEIFQVGEKSWTRWETGKHRPSRSINVAIRALYDGEISIDYLLQRCRRQPLPAKPVLNNWFSISNFSQGSVKLLGQPIPLRSASVEQRLLNSLDHRRIEPTNLEYDEPFTTSA